MLSRSWALSLMLTLRQAGAQLAAPLQRRCRASDAPGATRGDVAIGFVPAHRALQRCCYGARAKTQFPLSARAIHKHLVARDFHALYGNLRLAKGEPRKYGISIRGAKGQAVRDLHARRAQTRDFRERIEDLLQREIFGTQQIALTDFAFFGNQ